MNKQVRSPLGSSTFEASGGKNFSVPDFSSGKQAIPPPAMERLDKESIEKFNEIKRATAEGKTRITSGSRSRIELLMGLGKLTEEVVIGEYRFLLESLSGRQLTEVNDHIRNYNKDNPTEVAATTHARSIILCYSVKEISGQDVELVTNCARESEELYQFFMELDDNVATVLFAGYHKLKKKCDASVETDINKLLEEIKK